MVCRSITLSAILFPVSALAAPQCAIAEARPSDSMVVPVPKPAAIYGGHTTQQSGTTPVANVPALQHIISAGATLTDIGMSHGLRTVFARNGSKFQVFYVSPDGRAVVGGVMWDASGKNVTRQQVVGIPGAIPTVTIGSSIPDERPSAAAAITPSEPSQPSLVAAAEHTSYGIIGAPTAPRLWMFIDPLCSFSVRAMAALKPYVANGKVQLAVVPVAVLDYEDQGKSTSSARMMLSQPTDSMVQAWEDRRLTGSLDPAAIVKLASNMATADALHLKGTPTFVWRKGDGTEGMSAGVPPDLDALLSSIAS